MTDTLIALSIMGLSLVGWLWNQAPVASRKVRRPMRRSRR